MDYELATGVKPSVRISPENLRARASGNDVIAFDRYMAIEFRDENNKLFHRYDLPEDAQNFKHYLRYFGRSYYEMNAGMIKFNFVTNLLFVVRKISIHRKRISILEIGSTLGENYYLLRKLIKSENLGVEIDFVGIDLDGNAIALATELHYSDPNFRALQGDGSDLSRFPDGAFDIVTSNGVVNYVHDPDLGFKETIRVARVCTLLQMLISPTEKPFWVTYHGGLERAIAPTTAYLNALLRPFAPLNIFDLNKYWSNADRSKRNELSDGDTLEDFDEALMKRKILVLSKFNIFPELYFLKTTIS
jgi:ubiquinone/menaquinone biosynthesis C-methylase UbiE